MKEFKSAFRPSIMEYLEFRSAMGTPMSMNSNCSISTGIVMNTAQNKPS